MKRSKPLERGKPLKRGAPPKRRRKALTLAQRDRATGWHHGIGKTCAVCGNTYNRDCEAHHIVRVQTLRKQAAKLGLDLDRIRWDNRNRLPVCDVCHQRHHSRFRPIPMRVLREHAPKVFQFARELKLGHVLEREYPDTNPKEST